MWTAYGLGIQCGSDMVKRSACVCVCGVERRGNYGGGGGDGGGGAYNL